MKLLADSLIRRYTPPTCTLEIWAKRSPLSFWSDRQLVKDLRFELHFDDPRTVDREQIFIRGDRVQLQQLNDTVSHYIQNYLQQPSLPVPAAVESKPSLALSEENLAIVPFPSAPSLKPKGLLSHELSFGSLEVNASDRAIQLSVSQLFDLAEALEQFNTEIETLPVLGSVKGRKTAAIWAGAAAAAVAILAVGVTTVGTRLYQASNPSTDVATSNQPTKSSEAPKSNVTDITPIVPPAPTNEPVPSPTVPSSLQNRDALPPPPTVEEPTKLSGNAPVPTVMPPAPSMPSTATTTPSQQSQQPTVAIVPNESPSETPQKKPANATQKPATTARNGNGNVKLPELPSLESDKPTAADSEVANAPAVSQSRKQPQDSAAPASAPNPSAIAPSNEESSATSEQNNNSGLLDTIPQVAQARQYFQERWQVPDGLNQRLEYRLVVNKEGAIARIVPLGRAANVYLDRTQMPLMGTPFVSPLEVGDKATIRLVLNPDGSVKTFLEE